MLACILFIFVVALWPNRKKPPEIIYRPKNVMGDGDFTNDDELKGKLRLR